ncbi:MAG: hypothetical protein ABEJ61_11445 [Haloferacaceae archaeon]
MSRTDRLVDDLPPAVCDYCGEQIVEDEQRCPARDEGVCRP